MTSPVHLIEYRSKDVVWGPLEKVLAFSKGNPVQLYKQRSPSPASDAHPVILSWKKKRKDSKGYSSKGGRTKPNRSLFPEVRNEVKLIAKEPHQPRSSGSQSFHSSYADSVKQHCCGRFMAAHMPKATLCKHQKHQQFWQTAQKWGPLIKALQLQNEVTYTLQSVLTND